MLRNMGLRRDYFAILLLGFGAGFFMSLTSNHLHSRFLIKDCDGYQRNFETSERGIRDAELSDDDDDDTDNDFLDRTAIFNDSLHHADDNSLAERLFKKVRILCLVMTHPENHQTKAVHVNATWGRRCNKLLFVTRLNDSTLPMLIVDISDGRDKLPNKTRATFNKVFTEYLHDFEWFLKADDDTYVIMENLRYFLSEKDHGIPLFFGQNFVKYVKQGYASGGAAYILSREALRLFGEKNYDLCKFDTEAEDIDFGKCMERVGVLLGDSLDAAGRTRFHCFHPTMHIVGGYPDWYSSYDKYEGKKVGIESMSDYAITFHYISPDAMYLLEYLIYHLNPYGIIKGLQNLNTDNHHRRLNGSSEVL